MQCNGSVSMDMNHENINSFIAFLKVHPFFSFVIAIFAATSNIDGIYNIQIPQIIMQAGQLAAWGFVCVTGTITVLGFIEKKMGIKINLRFFKKKR